MKTHRLRDETGRLPAWGREVTDENGNTTHQRTTFRLPEEESVGTIMTRTTYCVKEDVTIEAATALLLEHAMSGMPVVDDEGRPIGLISKTDLLRHFHESGDGIEAVDANRVARTMGTGFHPTAVHGTPVREVMMPVVFAVDESASIACAAALMAGENVHRLPVLADDGTIAGILSTLDIVRWVAAGAGYSV
jgi:CBS domain-containing protein